jgi:hypothetical protein
MMKLLALPLMRIRNPQERTLKMISLAASLDLVIILMDVWLKMAQQSM